MWRGRRLGRIAVPDHDVGGLARCDRAHLIGDAEDARGRERECFDAGGVGQAARHREARVIAHLAYAVAAVVPANRNIDPRRLEDRRSEEHTSELQSLMRISYAVFCLKKTKDATHKYGELLSHTHTNTTT